MTEKSFSIEHQNEEKQPNYKEEILKIINDYEKSVRAVSPDVDLDREIHQEKVIGHEEEWKEFEEVRKDVCESFGVSDDERHVYIHDKENAVDVTSDQRAFRAFCVVIDALTDEKFYGEGRTWHVDLFNTLAARMNNGEADIFAEKVFYGQIAGASRYLFFKGFIANDSFQDLSERASKIIRTPIYDGEGSEIKTPDNWFITGHNLPKTV
jgi:hypothetical protein